MEKTIIAIGGAGFARTGFVFERYILEQTKKEKPAILFIPTASGDSHHYITLFYDAFNQLPCIPHHLSLFNLPRGIELRDFVLSHDVIYVGGGNTKNMLALWREWGLDLVLRQAWEKGIVLAGTSAGSLCWFEQGITDSLPQGLTVLSGLGFLPGSNCPHYNDESDRRPLYQQYMLNGQIMPGIAQDQCVGLHYSDTTLHRILTIRDGQCAYGVSVHGVEIVETVKDAEKIS